MNIKPYAYHWVNSSKLDFILENGLKPTGGVALKAVYLTTNYKQFFEDDYYDTLLAVSLKGLENNIILYPEKKWIMIESSIDKNKLFFIYNHNLSEEKFENYIGRLSNLEKELILSLKKNSIITKSEEKLKNAFYYFKKKFNTYFNKKNNYFNENKINKVYIKPGSQINLEPYKNFKIIK